jgi:hypothetical protein
MDVERDELARQELVNGIVSRLHQATDDVDNYRTIFADIARQLLDRMDDGTEWRTPIRHPATAALMADLVDPAVKAHTEDPTERRLAYAQLFEKVSVSVVSGIQQERMRAEFERRQAA